MPLARRVLRLGLRESRRERFLGDELSDAEVRIPLGVADGSSIADVARELWLSPNTVKTYRRSIYRKLGASLRQEMTELARVRGLLESRSSPVTHCSEDTPSGRRWATYGPCS